MLQKEADELCKAKRYERSEGRLSTRAGHYQRKLHTKAGEVTLQMPRLRSVPFETAIFERYRRRESSVEEALIEMKGRRSGPPPRGRPRPAMNSTQGLMTTRPDKGHRLSNESAQDSGHYLRSSPSHDSCGAHRECFRTEVASRTAGDTPRSFAQRPSQSSARRLRKGSERTTAWIRSTSVASGPLQEASRASI